jgi:hypothetical protein
MNAYELADELEGFGYLNSDDGLHFCPFQAQVDMLRQQQAEIEALKLKYKQEFEYVEKKFSDEWWKGVAEYNKGKAQEK